MGFWNLEAQIWVAGGGSDTRAAGMPPDASSGANMWVQMARLGPHVKMSKNVGHLGKSDVVCVSTTIDGRVTDD